MHWRHTLCKKNITNGSWRQLFLYPPTHAPPMICVLCVNGELRQKFCYKYLCALLRKVCFRQMLSRTHFFFTCWHGTCHVFIFFFLPWPHRRGLSLHGHISGLCLWSTSSRSHIFPRHGQIFPYLRSFPQVAWNGFDRLVVAWHVSPKNPAVQWTPKKLLR